MGVDKTQLLTTAEVAKILGVKPATLANWRHLHRGPEFVRLLNRMVRYPEASLYDWIKEQVVGR